MELPAWVLAGIRTAVQASVGAGLAWLAAKGIVIEDSALIEGALFAIITGAAAAGLRLLEGRFPWVSRILSLGVSARQPEYE
jgi:hypothetical protein